MAGFDWQLRGEFVLDRAMKKAKARRTCALRTRLTRTELEQFTAWRRARGLNQSQAMRFAIRALSTFQNSGRQIKAQTGSEFPANATNPTKTIHHIDK